MAELARKILELIERTEQAIAQDAQALDDIDERIELGVIRYATLKAEIKKLCQEQVKETA